MIKCSQNYEFTGGSKGMVYERVFSKKNKKKIPWSIQPPPPQN